MNIFQAIILGIVQGLTEFMPVSSSGHLVLLQKIFNFSMPAKTLDIVLHMGTLIPVLIVFKKDLIALFKNPFQKMTYLLGVATIPAVIAALAFGDLVDSLFQSGSLLALGFLITGILLMSADSIVEGDKTGKEITYFDAIFIGCMQAIAITPAISRSGSTITGALSRKLKRETAAKFSFLLSIPAILGASVLEIKSVFIDKVDISEFSALPVLFGFIAAVLSGYLSIRFMLALIRSCKLRYFSYYVFALCVLITFDQFITKIFF